MKKKTEVRRETEERTSKKTKYAWLTSYYPSVGIKVTILVDGS